jgi:hypothetical protein
MGYISKTAATIWFTRDGQIVGGTTDSKMRHFAATGSQPEIGTAIVVGKYLGG